MNKFLFSKEGMNMAAVMASQSKLFPSVPLLMDGSRWDENGGA